MAVAPKHLSAVGGIAVVALAGGFGIARLTGDEPAPPPKRSAAEASLPSLGEPAVARIAVLGAAPALPSPRTARTRRKPAASGGGSDPEPTATAPSADPTPEPQAPAPNTPQAPPAPTAAPPAPERTPVVGGGTGGEEP